MFYRLSDTLALRSRWRPYLAKAAEQVLVVKSGEAFPPSHPTTRLCLDLLREAFKTRTINSLADVGCGTGILGLAAAALGVPQVVGVDILTRAARIARDNARANQLSRAILVVRGSTECLKGPFDLVVANLPWEVQLDKVSELDRLVADEGRLIISGFRDNQEDALRESYLNLGWRLARRLVKDFSHPELPPDISFTWVAWRLEAKSLTGRTSRQGKAAEVKIT